ncbi:hypothetical protein GQ42DRAFT_178671 [Ramicandelaber brevisporus]|nr:hypothetical protein GQ42DRAFT_178671 [Ramicandelaber brevisporus]
MLFKWLKSRGRRRQSTSSIDGFHLTESGPPATVSELFVLPYELLEEIATAYFSRHEAATLRTVNSQFHAAFSRTFWHTLVANSSWMQSLPDTIWQKYGHLVRCARMEVNQLSVQWCKKLPGLIQVTLDISRVKFEMVEGIELMKLRRIQLIAHNHGWPTTDIIKCMDLVQKLEQRNKSLLVHLDLVFDQDHYVTELVRIVQRIDDITRHSFTIAYNVSHWLAMPQFSKLSKMLVKLDISHWRSQFRGFFQYCNNNIAEYTFPRLTTLIIRSHYTFSEDELLKVLSRYQLQLANH